MKWQSPNFLVTEACVLVSIKNLPVTRNANKQNTTKTLDFILNITTRIQPPAHQSYVREELRPMCHTYLVLARTFMHSLLCIAATTIRHTHIYVVRTIKWKIKQKKKNKTDSMWINCVELLAAGSYLKLTSTGTHAVVKVVRAELENYPTTSLFWYLKYFFCLFFLSKLNTFVSQHLRM